MGYKGEKGYYLYKCYSLSSNYSETAQPIFMNLFFVYLMAIRIDRKVFFTIPLPPPIGAITGILRFTMEMYFSLI